MSNTLPFVAIIDDDEIHAFVIERLMYANQFAEQVSIFSNGKKALEFFSSDNHTAHQLPDIILLDIEMPVMDAWSFLDEFGKIKDKLSKEILIYILTTSISKYDEQKAASHPEVTAYLIKPLKKEDLASIAVATETVRSKKTSLIPLPS